MSQSVSIQYLLNKYKYVYCDELPIVFNFLHNSLNFHEDVAGSNKLPAREKNQSSLTWKNT